MLRGQSWWLWLAFCGPLPEAVLVALITAAIGGWVIDHGIEGMGGSAHSRRRAAIASAALFATSMVGLIGLRQISGGRCV